MGRISIDRADVGSNWPLIRYLLDESVYAERYRSHLREIVQGIFEPSAMEQTYLALADRLRPYVPDESSFDSAVVSLQSVTQSQVQAVQQFVA